MLFSPAFRRAVHISSDEDPRKNPAPHERDGRYFHLISSKRPILFYLWSYKHLNCFLRRSHRFETNDDISRRPTYVYVYEIFFETDGERVRKVKAFSNYYRDVPTRAKLSN